MGQCYLQIDYRVHQTSAVEGPAWGCKPGFHSISSRSSLMGDHAHDHVQRRIILIYREKPQPGPSQTGAKPWVAALAWPEVWEGQSRLKVQSRGFQAKPGRAQPYTRLNSDIGGIQLTIKFIFKLCKFGLYEQQTTTNGILIINKTTTKIHVTVHILHMLNCLYSRLPHNPYPLVDSPWYGI
jgi:hypothetical protein